MREFPESWPPPETLLTRVELARLLGVKRETLKAWDYRGKGPPKVAKGTFCRSGSRSAPALYRCGDVLQWLEQRQRHRLWVETAIGAVPTQPASEPQPQPQPLSVLTRPETAPESPELVVAEEQTGRPEVVAMHTWNWQAVEDDEPFPSNSRRPGGSARYW
jgi:hypothetical protein